MKTCIKCNNEKDINEFRKVGKYYRNTCKSCENLETIESQRVTQAYLKSFKTECSICGYSKCKNALDFHHLDSDEKEYTLSNLRGRKWSEHTKILIDSEVEKCIIVCANCHREIHDNNYGE